MKKCTKSLYTECMQNMRKNLQERKLRPNLYIQTVYKGAEHLQNNLFPYNHQYQLNQ